MFPSPRRIVYARLSCCCTLLPVFNLFCEAEMRSPLLCPIRFQNDVNNTLKTNQCWTAYLPNLLGEGCLGAECSDWWHYTRTSFRQHTCEAQVPFLRRHLDPGGRRHGECCETQVETLSCSVLLRTLCVQAAYGFPGVEFEASNCSSRACSRSIVLELVSLAVSLPLAPWHNATTQC